MLIIRSKILISQQVHKQILINSDRILIFKSMNHLYRLIRNVSQNHKKMRFQAMIDLEI